MYLATLLLCLVAIDVSASLPAPDSDSIDWDYHINAKRDGGWCTFHYYQSATTQLSWLEVYDVAPTSGTAPRLGGTVPLVIGVTTYNNGAFTPLPGYGDFLVAANDADKNVTFSRHGTISGDSWTILESDEGTGLTHECSVGAWNYGDSRSMDCGFSCTPYTGPYAQST
ncbi:hypothetical protein P7C71_g5414, partial [Lecanoromycetidae sp. Uapishka_2]